MSKKKKNRYYQIVNKTTDKDEAQPIPEKETNITDSLKTKVCIRLIIYVKEEENIYNK